MTQSVAETTVMPGHLPGSCHPPNLPLPIMKLTQIMSSSNAGRLKAAIASSAAVGTVKDVSAELAPPIAKTGVKASFPALPPVVRYL